MNSGQLIVIFLVSLIVFGPKKLPMLARHLGQLWRYLTRLKQQALQFWEQQLADQQLKENSNKAVEADKIYEKENK